MIASMITLRHLALIAIVVCAACSSDDDPPKADTGGSGKVDGAPTTDGKIGSPCVKNADCEHDICRLKRGSGTYPGGYCSKTCDAVSAPCPAGAHCAGTANGDCFKICTDRSQCRQGYDCVDPPGGGPPRICFPE